MNHPRGSTWPEVRPGCPGPQGRRGVWWPTSVAAEPHYRASWRPSERILRDRSRMGEDRRKRDLESLKGLVHTRASSIWTGMRYRSLTRRYPNEYTRFLQEEKHKGDRQS